MVDTAIGIKYIYMAGSCDEETKRVVKQFVLGRIASCTAIAKINKALCIT